MLILYMLLIKERYIMDFNIYDEYDFSKLQYSALLQTTKGASLC